jgi:hypothetical protein
MGSIQESSAIGTDQCMKSITSMCPERIMKSQNANELMTKKGIKKGREKDRN